MTPESRYFDRFLRKSKLQFAGRVLDVGCGNGRFSRRIAQQAEHVVAIDVAPHDEWNQAQSGLEFAVGNAEELAFPDRSFDTVFAMNMLHHTESPARAIGEIHRVCKPGGQIIIVEPNRWNPLGYVHLTLMGNHQHFPTRRFLELARGGLSTPELRQFECHCYPVPTALLAVAEVVEDVLDKVPFWKPFVFYNIVLSRKCA